MRDLIPTWACGLLSLQATFSTALSLGPRSVASSSLAQITSSTNGYTELESGVRIYGTWTSNAETTTTTTIKRQSNPSAAAAGWCGASNIFNEGSNNSPLISDCQVIMDQVYSLAQANNAYFGRSECNPDSKGQFTCYFPVVSYGTCMFGASTIDSGTSIAVRIGWQDVGDLIKDSISQCGNKPSSGKVGTSGEMSCPEEINAATSYATGWGLYHS
ncbi:hypothetical protein JX265_001182 [Neoarthrinium moseri]|uniref:Ecp2 effector protein-like domain-containing protein n=1 Tax=Neoarthrinium moseri TaxID=1658444 RepID=A0A9Q0ARN5_9PEZI|nr:uncharacterized protein JN550_007356 [Neoarthrinium moseri]KAI1848852.1 hypothetical protein JX266_005280 [Neoarthrinium moseri]KAI1866809.1 hypothetical protein JN550_007356 [Neoarthrinium moseri]KAI1880942.1 hypothetical protein JX265_001182 [Neoarthrinium moseri]